MPPFKSSSPALLALGAAAAALPGLSRAQTAGETRADYRYSHYREADLPAAKTDGQPGERYTIETHQFRVQGSLGEQLDAELELTHETMSGASPWFVQPDGQNRPVQVMSGASIREQRSDMLLRATRQFDDLRLGLVAGYSDEDDYRAVNTGLELGYALDDTVTSLSAGVGFSDDRLRPTQGATPTGVSDAARDAVTLYAGAARVLSADSVIQSSVSYTLHEGYLSDPYKAVFIVGSGITPDRRPGQRQQWTWLTRLRHYLVGARAAVHADYRWYEDDWRVRAHTLDVAWHQNLGRYLRLAPALRWYRQSQAFFHRPFFDQARADALASSDYRLSAYGALAPSLTLTAGFDTWNASLAYHHYDSDAGQGLGGGAANPGLVDFAHWSLGVNRTF